MKSKCRSGCSPGEHAQEKRQTMFNWISFLTYAVVTTVTPGPNTITSMTNGSRKGFCRALPYNFGIWVGFSVVMVFCAVGCSLLSALIPRIKTPMLMVGAAYILYLAWKTFCSSGIQERTQQDGFLAGLFLQFVNPKIYIYGIVSMEVYILPYFSGQTLALLGFALLLSSIGFFFTLCWSAFGSVFRRLFSKYARVVNTVMALLLVYCAVSLFLN